MSGRNCFGRRRRDIGQRRLPEPPERIKGQKEAVTYALRPGKARIVEAGRGNDGARIRAPAGDLLGRRGRERLEALEPG
jgi:hypothetical protein